MKRFIFGLLCLLHFVFGTFWVPSGIETLAADDWTTLGKPRLLAALPFRW